MTNNLPTAIRAALAPFAPADSSVQLTEAERLEVDKAMYRGKLADDYGRRLIANAERLQMADQTPRTVEGWFA